MKGLLRLGFCGEVKLICVGSHVKTTVHIHRLFEKFGFDEVFGRSAVMELLVIWDLLGICHLHLC